MNSVRTGAFALCVFSSPALADLTARQVWQDWGSHSASYGQTVTGTEMTVGDSLVVTDIKISMKLPGGEVNGAIDRVEFKENGDGTVTVILSPDYPVSLKTKNPDGDVEEMETLFRQDGLKMIASGDETTIRYDVTGPGLSFEMTRLTVNGKERPLELLIRIADIAASYGFTLTETGQRSVMSEGTARSVNFRVASSVPMDESAPGEVSSALFLGEITDISGKSSSIVPDGMNSLNLWTAIGTGFVGEGEISFGATSYSSTVKMPDQEATTTAVRSGAGKLAIELSEAGLRYGVTQTDVVLSFTSPILPIPELNVAMERSESRLMLPLVPSDEPRDFALMSTTKGLTLNEDFWAMFDPSGVLPRDPATMVLDLSGKMRLPVDVLAPTLKNYRPEVEVESVALNDLTLSMGGAILTGTGAFTVDNSTAVPNPDGTVNLRLEGGNALLDNLVTMGLVPPDQANGLRMMIGLFARPGEGEDTLVSDITFKDRQILANGQRLK
ncbi:DUF2125 domain-containing protein [Rhodovulum imhoffii]|nr:DUF2125 domain-containing protein [Rhodovulum imhoffii]